MREGAHERADALKFFGVHLDVTLRKWPGRALGVGRLVGFVREWIDVIAASGKLRRDRGSRRGSRLKRSRHTAIDDHTSIDRRSDRAGRGVSERTNEYFEIDLPAEPRLLSIQVQPGGLIERGRQAHTSCQPGPFEERGLAHHSSQHRRVQRPVHKGAGQCRRQGAAFRRGRLIDERTRNRQRRAIDGAGDSGVAPGVTNLIARRAGERSRQRRPSIGTVIAGVLLRRLGEELCRASQMKERLL